MTNKNPKTNRKVKPSDVVAFGMVVAVLIFAVIATVMYYFDRLAEALNGM